MKRSYYIYNNGILKRQDNTITFIDETLTFPSVFKFIGR